MLQKIINNFTKLITKEKAKEKTNVFKIRSYQKVIKLFNNEQTNNYDTFTIDDFTTFLKKNGMKNPKKTIDKISQIIETGEIKEATMSIEEKDKINAVKEFTSVYAIGPAKAKDLYLTYNIKTVKELRQLIKNTNNQIPEANKPQETKKSKTKVTTILNKKQLIGLQYYEDLLKRIPRKEIKQFDDWIKHIIQTKYNNQIQFTIAGSYRRGKKTSGDIDLLITSNVYKNNEAMNLIIQELKDIGYLKETLAKGKKKFMGIISIDNQPCRHLDIVETTEEDYPFAILYFTGSGPFNVKMRKLALDKGYSINEYAMTIKKTKERVDHIFKTEKDIFTFLEMDYKSPVER